MCMSSARYVVWHKKYQTSQIQNFKISLKIFHDSFELKHCFMKSKIKTPTRFGLAEPFWQWGSFMCLDNYIPHPDKSEGNYRWQIVLSTKRRQIPSNHNWSEKIIFHCRVSNCWKFSHMPLQKRIPLLSRFRISRQFSRIKCLSLQFCSLI